MNGSVDLAKFNNSWYQPGSSIKRLLWYACNALFFKTYWFPLNTFKIQLMKLFGAKIGTNVRIKPNVNVKYPWFLEIGNYVWIGEGVWLDCLGSVKISDHVCISQGALVLSGSHNYNKSAFDLLIKPIELKKGSWVGAKAIVTQGTIMESHALLAAGSVASGLLKSYGIYKGNPAILIKKRAISE